MQKAGVDTTVFKPHSTRVASTRKARRCKVLLPAVNFMKATSWQLEQLLCFQHFLRQPS